MQDGLQGVSHDRLLMRLKDYLQIITTIGGLIWGGLQVVRSFDRMNQQIAILQQQVSHLQQLVVNENKPRRRR
jgi:hypothetical protein